MPEQQNRWPTLPANTYDAAHHVLADAERAITPLPMCADCDDDGHCTMNCGPSKGHVPKIPEPTVDWHIQDDHPDWNDRYMFWHQVNWRYLLREDNVPQS